MNKLHQHTTLQLLLNAWSNDRNRKIGTDSMLRIQQLVNQLPEECEAASFRNMLAALLVKSPEEQKEFYALFKQCQEDTNKLIEGKVEGKKEKSATKEEDKAKKKFQYSIAYFILALVLLIGGVYWINPAREVVEPVERTKDELRVIREQLSIGDTLASIDIRAAENTVPIESINPSGTQKTNRNHTVVIDDSGFVTFIANGDRTANVRDTFDAYLNYTNQIDSVRLIVTLTEKAKVTVDTPIVDDELRVIREQLSIGDTLPSIDIRAAENTAPIENINPSGTQKTNRNHTVVIDDSGFVTFIANGDSTTNVRDTFDAYLNYADQIDTVRLVVTLTEKTKVTIDTPIVDKAFLDPIPLLKPNGIDSLIISKEEIAAGEWWDKWKWPIVMSVIILLGILLWGIWRWIQYQRAKVVADLQNTDKAPYIWHPETGAINQEWLEEVSRPLLNRFRSRTPDDALLLDIPATIKVTSQQAGRLSLQYTNRTLPPNYLLLIDRYSAQDHQARLFDALYQHLKKEEIPVYRYYFNGDPRICTNEAFPNGITLVELMQKHASAKLLIVGEGMGLLSQRSGRLAPWTAMLEKWKNKVLLSPKVRNEWGVFEKVLEDLFLVLPASPQGLSMAVESFLAVDTPMQAELWPKVKDSILSPIALDGPLIASLQKQFEKTPAMVDWIAACAVWPKLSWDLTLHLGSIIDEQLIRFDHLREMNRLPWFIQGNMPREVRELLLDYLQAQGLEEKVRTAIQELFEKLKNKPQKGSVADDYYQMNIILNELFLNPDKEKKKQLEKQFADYLAAGNDPDFVALRLLDRKPNRIDQLLGNRFKKYVYKQGLPKLGLQKWIWLATTWAVLSLGICIGAYFSGETALCSGLEVAYKEHTLCLENERDRLLYYQQLAKDAIEAQNHEQVDSIKALADAIKPLDSIFYLNTAYNYHNYGVSAYNCSVEEDPTCGFQVSTASFKNLACYNFEKGIALLRIGDVSVWNAHPLQLEAYSNCKGSLVPKVDTPRDTTIEIRGYIVDRITNTTVANADIRLGYASNVNTVELELGTSSDVYFTKSNIRGNFVIRIPKKAKAERIQIRITQELYDDRLDNIYPSEQEQKKLFVLEPNEEAFIKKTENDQKQESYLAYLDRFPNGLKKEEFENAVIDTDFDGIPDVRDKCPENYGVIDGCPDVNNNGITDSEEFLIPEIMNVLTTFGRSLEKLTSNISKVDKEQLINSIKKSFLDNAFFEGGSRSRSGFEITRVPILDYLEQISNFDNDDIQVTKIENCALLKTSENIYSFKTDFFFKNNLEQALVKANIRGMAILMNAQEKKWDIKIGDIKIGRIENGSVSNSQNLPIPPTELIPAGTFTMGCLSEERDGRCFDDEKPARTDLKVNAFYMGKYEVTNEEFAAFLNAEGNQEEGGREWVSLDGSRNKIQKDGDLFVVEKGFEKHPMIYVSWYGARAYCKWLSQQTGQNYRLPSEAEWEYAARGAEQGAKDNFFYSGSNIIAEVAWYKGNSGNKMHEVGKQQPNQLGLYDMSGNVWEWCADPWQGNYENAPKDSRVWEEGGNNTRRVMRGGSWGFNTWSCRVANRSVLDPDHGDRDNGFRVARDP